MGIPGFCQPVVHYLRLGLGTAAWAGLGGGLVESFALLWNDSEVAEQLKSSKSGVQRCE